MEERPWFAKYEPRVPHNINFPNTTIPSFLEDSAKQYPSNIATNFVLKYLFGGKYTVGGKLSYQKLNELSDRFATALYQLGVRKGDRVAVMLPNSPQFVISFFGAMKIGAIVVNVNPTYTSRELKHQLNDSEAETIVLLNNFWPTLREVQEDTPIKRVVVAHIFDTLSFPSSLLVKSSQKRAPEWVDVPIQHNIFSFQQLLSKYSPTPPKIELDPDDVALFQYTGGTTGLPKAAMLTHRNLVSNTLQVGSWLTNGVPGNEKLMSAIPFFHVYGMTVCMLYGLRLGGEMVIVPTPRPIDNVMNVIQKERCTIYPGVPAMYIGIVNHANVSEYDLRSIKACISGSAPLPIEIQERFGQITGGRLVEGYGMTEASPVTHCNPVYGERRAGSIGIPLPNTEMKIISLDNGEEIPIGSEETGELLVRGPQVMKGYWKRPEDTVDTIDPEGWLHTGDIARIDADGYCYIVDRKKDMINASGFKVLPRDVEEVLFMHPKVLEAVVVGIPNPTRGDDTVTAYIVPKDEHNPPTVDEIKEFCKLHLAPYKLPRVVQFRNELPKTMVGKVLRRVLVEEEKQKQAKQIASDPINKQ
jgi:long-chain acyl-CoA synthetase